MCFAVAAAIKELHNDAVTFLAGMVRHYTMIAISQQAGTYVIFPFVQKGNLLGPFLLRIEADGSDFVSGSRTWCILMSFVFRQSTKQHIFYFKVYLDCWRSSCLNVIIDHSDFVLCLRL